MTKGPLDSKEIQRYFSGEMTEEECTAVEETLDWSDEAFMQLVDADEPLASITPELHGQVYRDVLAERALRDAYREAEQRADPSQKHRLSRWLEALSTGVGQWTWTSIGASRGAILVAEKPFEVVRIRSGENRKVLKLAESVPRLQVLVEIEEGTQLPIVLLESIDGSQRQVTPTSAKAPGVAMAEFKGLTGGEYLLLTEPG